MRRLPWLVLLALLAACAESTVSLDGDLNEGEGTTQTFGELAGPRLRIVAANLTSGNDALYDAPGTRILQGVEPDIVLIQEFRVGNKTEAAARDWVRSTFGAEFSYYREPSRPKPNGVISRYPIVASGQWDDPRVNDREFAWARIDLPGEKDLFAVSVHFLTSNGGDRSAEARVVTNKLRELVPAGHYVVVGGDFNTDNRNESCFRELSGVVDTTGPHPADHRGVQGTNANRNKPYDNVMVSGNLKARQRAVNFGGRDFPAGAVIDTRVYSPLAEIAPAQVGDSRAPQMQHMAVVKDFEWPERPVGDEPPPVEEPTTPADAGTVVDAGAVVVDAGAPPVAVDAGQPLLVLNEVLTNEPGTDAAGEFVELVNMGTAAMDLSGFIIADGAAHRHFFASGTVLAPGGVVVVFGARAGIPEGLTQAVPASTGTLGLSNSSDSIKLKDRSGRVLQSVTIPGLSDGVSWVRKVDGSVESSWEAHTTSSMLSASPGVRSNGAAF